MLLLRQNKKHPFGWSLFSLRFAWLYGIRCALQSVDRFGGARHIVRAADFTVPKCYRAFWTASTNCFAVGKTVSLPNSFSAKNKKHPFGWSLFSLRFAWLYGIRCALQSVDRFGGARHIVRAADFTVPKCYRAFWTASTNCFAVGKTVSLPNSFSAKNKKHPFGCFVSGGEGGIRTLEPLLMVTRFPIVRARPATRLLRISRRLLYILLGEKSSVF